MNFAQALGTMNQLIQEYNDLAFGTIEDLQKLPLIEVARKITKAIKDKD